uniref:Uncharacterized protein n=1 Tax=Palpitomonas bilix TaxID=652834 RepID=A0A7S3D128_9EUKA
MAEQNDEKSEDGSREQREGKAGAKADNSEKRGEKRADKDGEGQSRDDLIQPELDELFALASMHFAWVMTPSQIDLFFSSLLKGMGKVLGRAFIPLSPFISTFFKRVSTLFRSSLEVTALPYSFKASKGCNGNTMWRERVVEVSGTTVRWRSASSMPVSTAFSSPISAPPSSPGRQGGGGQEGAKEGQSTTTTTTTTTATKQQGGGVWTRLRLRRVKAVYTAQDPSLKGRAPTPTSKEGGGWDSGSSEGVDPTHTVIVMEPADGSRLYKLRVKHAGEAAAIVRDMEARRKRVQFVQKYRAQLEKGGYAKEVRGVLNEGPAGR